MLSPADVQDLAQLLPWARKKGFNVEVSAVPGFWRLTSIRDRRPAAAPDGGLAFTEAEARRFLMRMPDA